MSDVGGRRANPPASGAQDAGSTAGRDGPPRAVVRPARPEDMPRVFELVRELAMYERLDHVLANTPERLAAQLFDANAWPRVECLVAELAGEVVGYAIFYGCYSSFRGQPVIWLEDLCVTGARRRTGAGVALMRELARIAIERGCATLAWDVLDWNQPSIEFYQRLGSERGTEWHTYQLAGRALEALARPAPSPEKQG